MSNDVATGYLMTNAFDFIEENNLGDLTVRFDFAKINAGTYAVNVESVVEPANRALIGYISRSADDKTWEVTEPVVISADPTNRKKLISRDAAATVLWLHLCRAWKTAAHDGTLDTEPARLYREEKDTERFTFVVDQLQRERDRAEKEIETFAKELTADPLHAFEWGQSAVDAAGKLAVMTDVLTFLLSSETAALPPTERIEKLRTRLTALVIEGARSPSRSTSPMHNLADDALLVARARVLDDMRWYG